MKAFFIYQQLVNVLAGGNTDLTNKETPFLFFFSGGKIALKKQNRNSFKKDLKKDSKRFCD